LSFLTSLIFSKTCYEQGYRVGGKMSDT